MAFLGFGKSRDPVKPQNIKRQEKIQIINGYEIELETGRLISVPKGLTEYIIPKEVKALNYNALYNARETAKIIDLSQTKLTPIDLKQKFNNGFEKLEQIKVPNYFETIDNLLYNVRAIISENRYIIINIPEGLTEYSHSSNPFLENVELPFGIKRVDNFDHNNCTTRISIPGTLTNRTLPSIYQNPYLKELIIGEGIGKVSSMYHGLNNLEFVSIPSTLNEFRLEGFEMRFTSYPNPGKEHGGYKEKLTIEKAFDKDSYFGETKIKFEIPRKFEGYERMSGMINIYFDSDQVIINGYSISYDKLSPNGTYYVDYTNKTIKSLSDNQDINKDTTKNSKINSDSKEKTETASSSSPIMTPVEKTEILSSAYQEAGKEFDALYLEFILGDLDYHLRHVLLNMGKINHISSEKLWYSLKFDWEYRFQIFMSNKKINFDNKAYLLRFIETIKIRGIEIENNKVKCYSLQDFTCTSNPIPNIYREIIIVDYIIVQLISLLYRDDLIEYLTLVMEKKDDEDDYIKLNLKNLPLQMIAYAPLITPSVLSRVITYCGVKQINETTVIEYIEDLKKRYSNQNNLHK